MKREIMARRVVAAVEEERERREQMELLLKTLLNARGHLQNLGEMVERGLELVKDSDHEDHFHAEAGDIIVQAPRTLRDLEGDIAALEFMIMDLMSPDVREFMPRQLKDQWSKVTASSLLPNDQNPQPVAPNGRAVAEKFYWNTFNDGGQSLQDKAQYPVEESIHAQDQAWQRAKISPGGASPDQKDWSEFSISYPSTSIPKNIRR